MLEVASLAVPCSVTVSLLPFRVSAKPLKSPAPARVSRITLTGAEWPLAPALVEATAESVWAPSASGEEAATLKTPVVASARPTPTSAVPS